MVAFFVSQGIYQHKSNNNSTSENHDFADKSSSEQKPSLSRNLFKRAFKNIINYSKRKQENKMQEEISKPICFTRDN